MRARWGGIAAGLAVFGVGSLAVADPYENPAVELGVSAGVLVPSDEHELYDPVDAEFEELDAVAPDIGVRAGYLPLPFLGAEVELQVIPAGTDGDGSATIAIVRGHAIAQVPLGGPVTPFAVAGGGWMASSSDELGDDTDAVAHFGLGAKFHVKEDVLIRVDARLIRAPRREPVDPEGVGTNHGEILLGVSWRLGGGDQGPPPPPPDPDGDGFIGHNDACPNEAGEAPDGCPPRDRDSDGKLDRDDACPDDPEVVNGYEDDDGCPDEIPDTDNDGLKDPDDLCPDQPEDMDGHEDADGCPDPDNDDDGVTDDQDACPVEPGPVENRGCPDTDRDGDGVVDRIDNCPDEPGTEDNFGCKRKQLVQLTQTKLEILDNVYFRTNRANVQRRSRKLLNNIAAVLLAHPEIDKIRIEGHTDARGDDAYNKDLSQRRADAVRAYLIGKGVAAERLEAVGFGEEQPVADNETRAGQEQNRRVEFNIVTE